MTGPRFPVRVVSTLAVLGILFAQFTQSRKWRLALWSVT